MYVKVQQANSTLTLLQSISRRPRALLIRPPRLKIKTHLLKLTSILIIPQLRMDLDLRILILVVDHEVVVVVNVAGDDLSIFSVNFVFALVT